MTANAEFDVRGVIPDPRDPGPGEVPAQTHGPVLEIRDLSISYGSGARRGQGGARRRSGVGAR